MSKYTIEVRKVCEHYAGAEEYSPFSEIDDIVENSRREIFGDYPIFNNDEGLRKRLESKILKHYYVREICCETVGLWKLYLNNRMNEIMPYYNKMYESEALWIERNLSPFEDVNYTRDSEGESGREGTTESTGNSKNTRTVGSESNNTAGANTNENTTQNRNRKDVDKYSDTPQGGIDGMEGIETGLYLTNARIINGEETDTTKVENTSESTGHSEYNETTTDEAEVSNTGMERVNTTQRLGERVKGKYGTKSYNELLNEYRSTFINVDDEIIKKLSDLFFGLW